MANEKRLIDANKLIDKFWLLPGHIRKSEMDLIHCASTVDAVEVVRCKDCKHYSEQKKRCDHPC